MAMRVWLALSKSLVVVSALAVGLWGVTYVAGMEAATLVAALVTFGAGGFFAESRAHAS